MEKNEMEKRILEWNQKNEVALKSGYVKTQLVWSYNHKPVMPPNFSSDYYRGIGIIPNSDEIKMKNPINYVLRKSSHRNPKIV